MTYYDRAKSAFEKAEAAFLTEQIRILSEVDETGQIVLSREEAYCLFAATDKYVAARIAFFIEEWKSNDQSTTIPSPAKNP